MKFLVNGSVGRKNRSGLQPFGSLVTGFLGPLPRGRYGLRFSRITKVCGRSGLGDASGLVRGGGWVFEVVADEGYGVGGTFFHKPVAGVGDYGFAHVDGDVAHDYGFSCAEGFFSADGEDGHGEFGAGENLVVLY